MSASPGAIDIEQHFLPPPLLEAYRNAPPGSPGARVHARVSAQQRRAAAGDAAAGLPFDLEPRIEGMDEAGVALALLSVSALAEYPSDPAAAGRVADLAARCNDELLTAAARHPGRFGVLAVLPLPFVAESLAELDRLRGEQLVRGVIALAASDHWTLDRAELQPIYERLASSAMPVLIHPGGEGVHGHPMFADWTLTGPVAAMVDTTTSAARLMLSGMLDRVPRLMLIIPHLGGTLPYLAGRFVDQSGTGDAEHDVRYYLEHRVRLGTCSFHRPALHCAVETVGAEKIVLATDYPYRGTLKRAVDDVLASGLSGAEQQGILQANAAQLGLGLAGASAGRDAVSALTTQTNTR